MTSTQMAIGLSTYNISAHDLVELAVAADEAGFETLWLGEHLALPLDYASEHPTTGDTSKQHHLGPIIDPHTILLDPLVALGAAAARTQRIDLATGIYLLPLRHPLLIVRMTLTLQAIAGGRLLLGCGSGWLREEFDALSVPFDERGTRFDETIDVLRQAWRGDVLNHEGKHFRFGPVQMTPEPVHIPIILGGNTDRAMRRVAAKADGWFSSGTPSFEDALAMRERLGRHCTQQGRTAPLPIHMRVPKADERDLDRYRSEGFEHVVVWADQLWPSSGDVETKRARFFEQAAQRCGLRRGH